MITQVIYHLRSLIWLLSWSFSHLQWFGTTKIFPLSVTPKTYSRQLVIWFQRYIGLLTYKHGLFLTILPRLSYGANVWTLCLYDIQKDTFWKTLKVINIICCKQLCIILILYAFYILYSLVSFFSGGRGAPVLPAKLARTALVKGLR